MKTVINALSALYPNEGQRAHELDHETAFRRLVDSNTVAVFHIRLEDGQIIDANDAFLALSGFDRVDLENGRISTSQMTPPEAMGTELEMRLRLKNGEAMRPIELDIVSRSGERVPVLVGAASFSVAGLAIAYALDLSERKAYEKSLTSALRELKDIKFALDESSIVATTDARGTIQYVNDTFCKISGYDRSELIGQNHRILNSGFHSKEFFGDLWRTISSGKVWRGEVKNRAKDGSYYWVKTVIVPLKGAGGRPYQYIAIRNDITHEKKVQEDLLRAKREAEAANLAKTQFLANVSHEIRTPLGIILGFADLLRNEEMPESDRNQALDTILRNGDQLIKLIDEVLDVSKVETNHLEFEQIEFSLRRLIDDVVELLSFKAREKGLGFELKIVGDIPKCVKSDPTRLKQILTNVIGNAVKFTAKGGVSLEVHSAPSGDSGQTELKFIVVDTGIGLSTEQKARIFRPFSQADSSMTRRFGGTGLGLHLSRRLARALGGDLLLASSEPEQGSVFVVTVPVEVVHESDHSSDHDTKANPRNAQRLKGMKILIVDDSADNRALIGRYLKAEGAAIEEASNGKEGVESAVSRDFDAVLMDLQMPVMDGYEAITVLREKSYAKPVFALTAHALRSERERCLASGFAEHLVKPIDRSLLVDQLKRFRGEDDQSVSQTGSTIGS